MAFTVEAECALTSEGDELYLCGADPLYGAWEVSLAVQLRTSPEQWPMWTAQLPCMVGSEFKLLIRRQQERVDWESIGNRIMPDTPSPDQTLFLRFGQREMELREKTPVLAPIRALTLPVLLADRPRAGSDGYRCRFISSAGECNCLSERYKLEETTIGEGGFGSVHKAWDQALGTMRAVKRIEKSKALSLEDVNREIEMLRVMDHPNIVRLYATYEDERFLYLVMELCEGGELFDALAEATHLSEPVVQVAMRQVFGAVAHCHSKQIVHRDLKPENFILQKNAEVETSPLKLIDFGLATYCRENEELTDAYGTVLYVAPEVLGEKYNHACDVWSCGVLMYCLLCGSPPFHGKNESDILAKVVRGRYTMRGAHWMPVSSQAKHLVAKCLQKDVQQRISAVGALNHEWFACRFGEKGVETPRDLHRDLLSNLKSFCVQNRFKKAAMTAAAYHLTEEEQKELRRTFEKLDTDGDGFMTLQDLHRGLSDLPQMRGLNLAQLMDDLDRNQDGRLEYTEFIAAAMDQRLHQNEALCWRAFKAFDRDDDDRITYPDLLHVLQDPDLQMEVPNCRSAWQYFARMDEDGDGLVSFEDFMRMLSTQNTPVSASLYTKATFGALSPTRHSVSTMLEEDTVSHEDSAEEVISNGS
ncbi:unnamed protein product [Durusdinium trenchii]|uniref:Non-specific serine/threonine protein kinase n=2 Tax=Durusdinium trenchii TaxID=1381693 RepID=A0ABP0SI20_9DINO